jgi:hypothetical protein
VAREEAAGRLPAHRPLFPKKCWERALQRFQLFEQMMAVAVTLARILFQQLEHDLLGDRHWCLS